MSEEKNLYKIINKKEENRMLNVEVELPFEVLSKYEDAALKKAGENLEIKGFRKGSAPKKIVEENVGRIKILEEMAYQAITSILPQLIAEEKIDTLTQPKISITKIADNSPLVFKADFVLMPEIELSDYKKIAKEIPQPEKTEITDQEINDYIDYIRKAKADAEKMRKKTSADPKEREEAEKDAPLPEFNDDFVKTLGKFENVEDFKKQLKENMLADKNQSGNQKRRLAIIEEIINKSKVELPELMIEEELHQMLHQFEGDLKNAKMELDDYLKEIKKTKEDLMKEWRPDAIKRAKMNLILPKIAIEEDIKADPKLVEKEVEHLMHHHPNINKNHAEIYVSQVLRNEEVFKFLESIK